MFKSWLREATSTDAFRFQDNHRDVYGNGWNAEHKYTLFAYDKDEGGRPIGGVDYTVTARDNVCHIDHIEVAADRRREGIGEALMDYLSNKYGGFRKLDLGGYATKEGMALVRKMQSKNPEPDPIEELVESWHNGNTRHVARQVMSLTPQQAMRLGAALGSVEADKLARVIDNLG